MAQIRKAIRKKALGGNTIIPLVMYQPPWVTGLRISMPKRLPDPNSSRKNATIINTVPYPRPVPIPSIMLASGSFFMANAMEVYGMGSMVMMMITLAIGVFLVWLAKSAKSKEWIS